MKKLILISLLISSTLFAQFKAESNKTVDIKSGITNYSPSGFLMGFINPQNFNMNHSFSMSYSAFGNNSIALGVYTNNMSYQISDDLLVEADVSFVNSPYSSFGNEHAKSLNGVYLSGARLNYHPSEDFNITFQYNYMPNSFYSPYGSNDFFNRRNYWRY